MYRRSSVSLVMGVLTAASFAGAAHADPVRASPEECATFKVMAPSVNSAPGLIYIDPATGDTYSLGTNPGDKIFDCPPYDEE